MDIAGLSSPMSAVDVTNLLGAKLLKQSMEDMEDIGDGMVKMMQQSVTPHLGQNIDVSI